MLPSRANGSLLVARVREQLDERAQQLRRDWPGDGKVVQLAVSVLQRKDKLQ